jgi:hypothetical protein
MCFELKGEEGKIKKSTPCEIFMTQLWRNKEPKILASASFREKKKKTDNAIDDLLNKTIIVLNKEFEKPVVGHLMKLKGVHHRLCL